jgi:hypothetical protein
MKAEGKPLSASSDRQELRLPAGISVAGVPSDGSEAVFTSPGRGDMYVKFENGGYAYRFEPSAASDGGRVVVVVRLPVTNGFVGGTAEVSVTVVDDGSLFSVDPARISSLEKGKL